MKTLITLCGALMLLCSCKKDKVTVSTAEFTVSKQRVYMTESVTAQAVDSTGINGYTFYFGDGETVTGGHNAIHSYDHPGTYTVRMTADGKTFSKSVQVLPGVLSYQIKNLTSRELDILSYVDYSNSGTLYRNHYGAGTLSDSIFAANREGVTSQRSFYASIFISNSEYVINDLNMHLQERQNGIIEIRDSTQVSPRMVYGTVTPVYYLVDVK